MAENMMNLALSKQASSVANQMKESGLFPDALSAAKFGMAYAIKYYREDINDPDKLIHLDQVYDSQGNNYNIGSIDPDKYIADLMGAMYPNSDKPYTFARIIMCFGLNKLGDLLEEGRLLPINELM